MMKRKMYSFLTLTISVMMLAYCLVACNAGGTTDAVLTFVYEDKICISITETDGKANAFDALKSLRNKDLISFDYTVSTYGSYITSINGKAETNVSTSNSSEGYSWMLYTSDMEYAYESETISIGDQICGKAAMGSSSVIVKKGEIYVWVYEYYSYTW